MSNQGVNPQRVDVLNRASSLQLFQLSSLIQRVLGDPRRIIAVRVNMHLGQTVRFVDCRDGSLREDKYLQTVVGTIVRINDCTASIDPGGRHEVAGGLRAAAPRP